MKMADKDARLPARRQQGGVFSADEFFRNPFAAMRRMHDDMDRAFAGMWGQESGGGWSPAIEVKQRDGNYIVCAELPGLKQEDVHVEVTDEGLAIHGERKHEHEEDRGGFHHTERRYGSFYRMIPLPDGANADQAHAEFKDGVLEVKMPITEPKSRSRSIPIGSQQGQGTGEKNPSKAA